ncbi:MAG: hypothetical protein NVS3B16_04710 [Vulcanimicrobiaceae bacterium]
MPDAEFPTLPSIEAVGPPEPSKPNVRTTEWLSVFELDAELLDESVELLLDDELDLSDALTDAVISISKLPLEDDSLEALDVLAFEPLPVAVEDDDPETLPLPPMEEEALELPSSDADVLSPVLVTDVDPLWLALCAPDVELSDAL